MADLRKSLILPHGSPFIAPKGSQESFHSSHSFQAERTSSSPPNAHAPMPSEPPSQQPASSDDEHDPVLHDVDDYLGRPDNHDLLSPSSSSTTPTPKSKAPVPQPTAKPKPTATIVPVQVGAPKSSASVSRLNTICQQKGLLLDWDIRETTFSPPLFRGTLTIGAETLVLEVPQPSKKDVKQILAERGVEVAERMEARVIGASDVGEGGSGGNENWIGKLLEFYVHAATPTDGPQYIEYTDNLTNFACEVLIPHRPRPFGSRTTLFKTKKAAKTHAAMEAVQFLIRDGHLEPDGSVRRTKKAKLGLGVTAERAGADGGAEEAEKTWGMKVTELCLALAITPPEYRFAPTSPDEAPHILSGAAYFPRDPAMVARFGPAGGPVGAVRHVLGKKQAREECARGVWGVLEGVRRERVGE